MALSEICECPGGINGTEYARQGYDDPDKEGLADQIIGQLLTVQEKEVEVKRTELLVRRDDLQNQKEIALQSIDAQAKETVQETLAGYAGGKPNPLNPPYQGDLSL